MRTPGFWYKPAGALAWLLSPLAALYAAGTAWRLRKPGFRAGVPVICIGNLNAGGTGKTPTVIALIGRLSARGLVVHVVSRGYGGRLDGPLRVEEARHSAAEVGDEPLLLSAFAPVFVAKDRAAGVRAAQAAGAQVVLLDDGFQNPSVIKDLSLIVVDAARGFGNGFCLPAGPLREPVARGLARAGLLLSIGDRAAQDSFAAAQPRLPLPHLTGALEVLQMGMDWHGTRVLAFAGIGNPARFFATLAGQGAQVVGAHALDDHQPFTETLLRRLEADAAALDAQLVTTEKDAARLPAGFRPKVLTLPVRLAVADWSAFDAAVDKILPSPQTGANSNKTR